MYLFLSLWPDYPGSFLRILPLAEGGGRPLKRILVENILGYCILQRLLLYLNLFVIQEKETFPRGEIKFVGAKGGTLTPSLLYVKKGPGIISSIP